MANRRNTRNVQSLEKAPVCLYMRFAVGATGAPTLNAAQSKGILSMSRTGVGAYTINLGGPAGVDTYQRLMEADYISVFSAPLSLGMFIVADNSANAAPNVRVQFQDAAGAAVELASGEDIRMTLVLSNTTAF